MKTAVIEPPAVPLERGWTMADLAELVKARLTFLVLVTTAVGFYARLAGTDGFCRPRSRRPRDRPRRRRRRRTQSMVGTQVRRHHGADADAPDSGRPDVAARRLDHRSSSSSVGGVIYLALAVNGFSAFLAALTIGIYLFAYTPLKRISTANTLVGAIPGAIPPFIGWAAARETLDLPAPGPLCDSLFLANAAFFRHRLDVSRGLRAGRLSSCSPDDDEKACAPGRARASSSSSVLLWLRASPRFGLEWPRSVYLPIALSLGGLFLASRFAFKSNAHRRPHADSFFGSIIYLPLLLGAWS